MKLQRGSVAIASILIISAVTLLMVINMSELNSIVSEQNFNNIFAKEEYYGAEGCLEEALIRYERDQNFTATTIDEGDGRSCMIQVLSGLPLKIRIQITNVDFNETYEAEVSVAVDGTAVNMHLITWQEI